MRELSVPADVEHLAPVQEMIEAELESIEASPATSTRIVMAAEEIFVNIASYAYPDGHGNTTVRCESSMSPRRFRLVFIDEGIAYNPLEKADPDITLSAGERQLGGLGIFIVKKLMTRIEYRREGKFNHLMLEKILKENE